MDAFCSPAIWTSFRARRPNAREGADMGSAGAPPAGLGALANAIERRVCVKFRVTGVEESRLFAKKAPSFGEVSGGGAGNGGRGARAPHARARERRVE